MVPRVPYYGFLLTWDWAPSAVERRRKKLESSFIMHMRAALVTDPKPIFPHLSHLAVPVILLLTFVSFLYASLTSRHMLFIRHIVLFFNQKTILPHLYPLPILVIHHTTQRTLNRYSLDGSSS